MFCDVRILRNEENAEAVNTNTVLHYFRVRAYNNIQDENGSDVPYNITLLYTVSQKKSFFAATQCTHKYNMERLECIMYQCTATE